MTGFVTSPRAARALDFLRRVGPTPFPALAVALGLKPGQLAKALRHLRGAGYAYPVRYNGAEFWCADGTRPGPGQEVVAWFAARAEEAGARYEGGVVSFPNGQVYQVEVVDSNRLKVGKWAVLLKDLQTLEKPLRECLRRAEPEGRDRA